MYNAGHQKYLRNREEIWQSAEGAVPAQLVDIELGKLEPNAARATCGYQLRSLLCGSIPRSQILLCLELHHEYTVLPSAYFHW